MPEVGEHTARVLSELLHLSAAKVAGLRQAGIISAPDLETLSMNALVGLTTSGHIATITLDRPEALNAYTVALKDELITAIDVAEKDDDNVRAVVVTGAGRAFCAGMDLSNPHAFSRLDEDETARRRDSGGELALRLFEAHKPYIAAVNGAAVGVGATMTLPMDVRLASERAKFCFPCPAPTCSWKSASSCPCRGWLASAATRGWTPGGGLVARPAGAGAGLAVRSAH